MPETDPAGARIRSRNDEEKTATFLWTGINEGQGCRKRQSSGDRGNRLQWRDQPEVLPGRFEDHLHRAKLTLEPNWHFEATLYEITRQHPELQISAFHISSAENMREVESGSVDAVYGVNHIVLCSVGDPRQCLREIIRVLKLGDKLFFLEHVKAPCTSVLCNPLSPASSRLLPRVDHQIRRVSSGEKH